MSPKHYVKNPHCLRRNKAAQYFSSSFHERKNFKLWQSQIFFAFSSSLEEGSLTLTSLLLSFECRRCPVIYVADTTASHIFLHGLDNSLISPVRTSS